jgi:hypothetical protein
MSIPTKSPAAPPASHLPVDYLTDDHLAPGVRDFLKIVNAPGGKPVESLPVAAARQVLVDAQKAFKVDYSGIEETGKAINADGHTLELNLVRPEGAKSALPAFIFIHGGGWVLGDYPTHRRLVHDLVVASGHACVFVNFGRGAWEGDQCGWRQPGHRRQQRRRKHDGHCGSDGQGARRSPDQDAGHDVAGDGWHFHPGVL